jgi:hypothetical protein
MKSQRVLATNWSDRRRPEARDAVVVFGWAVLSFVVAHVYDLAPAAWELDNIIFVVFILSVAMMVFAFRGYRDLSRGRARSARASLGPGILNLLVNRWSHRRAAYHAWPSPTPTRRRPFVTSAKS